MPKPAPCHPRSSPARACGHPRGSHWGSFRGVTGSAGTVCQGWAVSSGAWWHSWMPFRGTRRFLGVLSPCGDFGTLARLFGDAGRQSHAGGDSPGFHSPVWFWGGRVWGGTPGSAWGLLGRSRWVLLAPEPSRAALPSPAGSARAPGGASGPRCARDGGGAEGIIPFLGNVPERWDSADPAVLPWHGWEALKMPVGRLEIPQGQGHQTLLDSASAPTALGRGCWHRLGWAAATEGQSQVWGGAAEILGSHRVL